MLSVDLGLFNKHSHKISFKESILYTILWITLAMIFNVGIYYFFDHQKAIDFLAGYLLEYSLSVDNIFVFLLLFTYFKVNPLYQHKVLFWGIIGAIVFRGILIILGASLIIKFHWIIYIFGIFLIFSGVNMFFQKEKKTEHNKNPIVKLLNKFFRITPDYVEGHFFVKSKGKLFATPLLTVLAVVETTDIVFAFDSIPAILAITQDSFIVFTSNAFAVLGLRSLYFALAGLVDKFRYLKYGLSIILVYIGIKMLLSKIYPISTEFTLGVLVIILSLSVVLSSVIKKK